MLDLGYEIDYEVMIEEYPMLIEAFMTLNIEDNERRKMSRDLINKLPFYYQLEEAIKFSSKELARRNPSLLREQAVEKMQRAFVAHCLCVFFVTSNTNLPATPYLTPFGQTKIEELEEFRAKGQYNNWLRSSIVGAELLMWLRINPKNVGGVL